MFPVHRQIGPHASRLRRDITDAEHALWAVLRNRPLAGFKFRRQATIGAFIVDFLCVEASLVVELDGGQHNAEADQSRAAALAAQSLRVIRFWNHDGMSNLNGVAHIINAALLKKTLTQPSPAKAGEG